MISDGERWVEALRGGRALTAYLACEMAMRAESQRGCSNPREHGHVVRIWTREEARSVGAHRFPDDGRPCWCSATLPEHSPVCAIYRSGWPPNPRGGPRA